MKRKIFLLPSALIILFAICLITVSRLVGHHAPNIDPANIVAFVSDNENHGEPCVSTPVYYPEPNPYTDIGEGIVNRNCFTLHVSLMKAAETGDVFEIRSAIARGANVNAPNDDYYLARPLMQAVFNDQVDAARLLIDNGANINFERTCCMSSTTALMVAVERSNREMVELLLSRGANANFSSRFEPNASILGTAIERRDIGIITMIVRSLIVPS